MTKFLDKPMLWIRNWIRFHLFKENPVCECGEVMKKHGFKNYFGEQHFGCEKCFQ